MKEIIDIIEKSNIGKVEKNAKLSKYTTYKTGGIAKAIVYPRNKTCLVKLIRLLRSHDVKYKILGNGSNLLFSDKTYNGVLIRLNAFDDIEFLARNKIRVGAGYSLMKLSLQCARKGLAGLEFAAGIPGTIGGAIFMNAGAYKSDMGYIVQSVKVLTPSFKVITMTNKELHFHYRDSFFQHNKDYICLGATLKLVLGKKSEIMAVNEERKKRRLESQPLEFPSAGSVFRNPEGMYAGKLIEDLGLKGLTKGGAQVSNKHANFIINKNNAKAEDIKELIEFVKEAVYEKYDVLLKVEQEFVNWE